MSRMRMRVLVSVLILAWPLAAHVGAGEPTTSADEVVEGVVFDAEGRPQAGVPVEARRAYPWRFFVLAGLSEETFDYHFGEPPSPTSPAKVPTLGATTDDRGRFRLRIPGSTAGVSYVLRARPEPPLRGVPQALSPECDRTSSVALHVRPGRIFRGRLVDEKGRPAHGWISAFANPAGRIFFGPSWIDEPHVVSDLETESDGRFAFVAPPGCRIRIDAHVPGRIYQGCAALADVDAQDVSVVMRPAGSASVRGRIGDLEGRPIAGARVLAYVRDDLDAGIRPFSFGMARTGTDGVYEIGSLPCGNLHALAVSAPGFGAWSRKPHLTPLVDGRPLVANVTLVRGARISVRVHNEEGVAIPRAEVTATGPPESSTGRGWTASAVTDMEGLVVLEGAPVGRGRITVAADGYYPPARAAGPPGFGPTASIYEVAAPNTTAHVEVGMRAGPTLPLRVVDRRGNALSGARVTLLVDRADVAPHHGLPWRPEGTTDANGDHEFRGLPPAKSLRVVATHADHPRVETAIDPAAPSSEGRIRIVLPDGLPVAGRVLDAEDAPVEGVVVHCETAARLAVTDAAGSFRFNCVTPGRRQIFLGYHATPEHSIYAEVGPSPAPVPRVLRYPSRETIEGRVEMTDGTGISGVLVNVARMPSQRPSATVFADPDGGFRLERVPSGRYRVSVASCAATEVETRTPEARGLRLRIPTSGPSFLVEGEVLDPEGRLVGQAPIRIAHVMDGPHTQRAATQVLGGRFRARVPGAKRALAFHVDAAWDAAGRELNVLPKRLEVADPTPKPVTIRLDPALSLDGRVVDEDGAPVAHVPVHVGPVRDEASGSFRRPPARRSYGAYSATDGTFRIRRLGSGPHGVGITPGPDWVPIAPIVVVPGEETVVIRLQRWRSLLVRVTGPDGQAVEGCRVRTHAPSVEGLPPTVRGYVSRTRTGTTDAQGTYRQERLPLAARLTVRVDPPDDAECHADLYPDACENVAPGKEPLEIRLAMGLRVAGRIVDGVGRPVAGARLHLVGPRRKADPQTRRMPLRPLVSLDRRGTSDDSGNFVFRRFPAGVEVKLYAEGPEGADPPFFKTVHSGLTTGDEDVEIVLDRTVAIEGHVAGGEASALEGLVLRAKPLSGGRTMATFRFDGTTTAFRLTPLRSGPHHIEMRGGQGLRYERTRIIEAPGQDVVLEITPVHAVAGVLLGAGKRQFIVEFHTAAGRQAQSRSDPEGLFRLAEVEREVGVLVAYRKDDPRVALVENVDPARSDPQVVQLEPGLPIGGRIVGLPANVVEGRVVASRGSIRFTGTVAADGRFRTPHLPPGAYALEFILEYPRDGSIPTPDAVEAGHADLVLEWAARAR